MAPSITVTTNIPNGSAVMTDTSFKKLVTTKVRVTINGHGTNIPPAATIAPTSVNPAPNTNGFEVVPALPQKVTPVPNQPDQAYVDFQLRVNRGVTGKIGFTATVDGMQGAPSPKFQWSAEPYDPESLEVAVGNSDTVVPVNSGTSLPLTLSPRSTSGNPYIGIECGIYSTLYGASDEGLDSFGKDLVASQDQGLSNPMDGNQSIHGNYKGLILTTDTNNNGDLSLWIGPATDATFSLQFETWYPALSESVPGKYALTSLIPDDPSYNHNTQPGIEGLTGDTYTPGKTDTTLTVTIPHYSPNDPNDLVTVIIQNAGGAPQIAPPMPLHLLTARDNPETQAEGYWEFPVYLSYFRQGWVEMQWLEISYRGGNPTYSDSTAFQMTVSSLPGPNPNIKRTLLEPRVFSADANGDPELTRELHAGDYLNIPALYPNGIYIEVPKGQTAIDGKELTGTIYLYGLKYGKTPPVSGGLTLPQTKYDASQGIGWHVDRDQLLGWQDDDNQDGQFWVDYKYASGWSHIFNCHLATLGSHSYFEFEEEPVKQRKAS
ncbi:MAG: hypothetical protein ACPW61_05545 [Methyloligella sp. ZOD6]